ncbi:serine/threonine-protein phosphatase [bacterium]|nr:serine/threonine-protein phosphatase [bacterium]
MSWNPFRRREDHDEAAEAQAGAQPDARMQGEDDPTDPLISTAVYSENCSLLHDWDGLRLESVSIGGAAAPAFLKLSASRESALSSALPGILTGCEALCGLRDLLADGNAVFSAALEPAGLHFDEFETALREGRISLRPLDLLLGMRDLALLLVQCSGHGLSWQPGRAGLSFTEVHAAGNGLSRWQLRFLDFGALREGTGADPSEVLTLLRPLVDAALADNRLLPNASSADLRALLDRLAADESLDAAAIAAGITAALNGLRLQGHGTTDNGMRRQHNEDAWLLAEIRQHSAIGSSLQLAVVADGMGGHESGEIASSLSLAMLRQQLQVSLTAPSTRPVDTAALPRQLESIIPGINRALIDRSAMEQAMTGMGTTLCGIVALSGSSTLSTGSALAAAFFNVGDSRAYLISGRELIRMTRDHSFVQQLVDSGEINADEAFDHPRKNVITRCLGGDGLEIQADVTPFRPGPAERILICSDGLTDALRDREIAAVLERHAEDPLPLVAQALVDAANAAGGPDNITVLLLDCRI